MSPLATRVCVERIRVDVAMDLIRYKPGDFWQNIKNDEYKGKDVNDIPGHNRSLIGCFDLLGREQCSVLERERQLAERTAPWPDSFGQCGHEREAESKSGGTTQI
jgi:hypothetical protein